MGIRLRGISPVLKSSVPVFFCTFFGQNAEKKHISPARNGFREVSHKDSVFILAVNSGYFKTSHSLTPVRGNAPEKPYFFECRQIL